MTRTLPDNNYAYCLTKMVLNRLVQTDSLVTKAFLSSLHDV